MISNQLTARIMPSEKAPFAFKLKTARSLKYKMYTKSSSLSYCWTSTRYVRSIPMLRDWEQYFSCWPFCLTRCQRWYLEVCLSAVCVVQHRNNNRKYMTRNPMSISTDRTFCFSWLPESVGKKYVSVYSIAFQALWKEKLFMYPPPLRKFVSFRLPYPQEIL